MPQIFISYRRSDSQDVAGRVYDRLAQLFGSAQIFKDVDSINPGEHYESVIRESIQQSDVVLVMIGPSWTTTESSDGRPRLHDPEDLVRLEVQEALGLGMKIIPTLIGGATMPTKDDLPESIHALVGFNAIAIRPDPDFSNDMDRLIAALGGAPERMSAGTSSAAPADEDSRKGFNIGFNAGSLGCLLTVSLSLVLMFTVGRSLRDPGDDAFVNATNALIEKDDSPPPIDSGVAALAMSDNEKRTSASGVLQVIYEESPPEGDGAASRVPVSIAIVGEFKKGNQGASRNLTESAQLASVEDGYRFSARASDQGWLYVFQVDAVGTVNWLFPKNTSPYSYGSNPVQPGEAQTIPDNGDMLTLDNNIGSEQVYFVFSRHRWTALENALTSYATNPPNTVTRIDRPFTQRTRGVGGSSAPSEEEVEQAPLNEIESASSDDPPRWQNYRGDNPDFLWVNKSFWHVE